MIVVEVAAVPPSVKLPLLYVPFVTSVFKFASVNVSPVVPALFSVFSNVYPVSFAFSK